jgi:hypothetical protein
VVAVALPDLVVLVWLVDRHRAVAVVAAVAAAEGVRLAVLSRPGQQAETAAMARSGRAVQAARVV